MTTPSYVVVGASVAGLAAATTLRASDQAGTVTVVGAERHTPYDRPPLTKQFLSGEWDRARFHLPGADDQGITWRLGTRAVAFDAAARRLDLDDGSTLEADGFVIATGSRARALPDTGHLHGIHTLRTLDDATALAARFAEGPERVVVVGGGFIGAEVAATARGMDLPVTLVEPLAAPLAKVLGEDIGQVFVALHRGHGVDVRTGVGVERVVADDHDRVRGVVLDDGTTLDTSLVVVGIGAVPNVEWLEGSGLVLDDGIRCDDKLFAAPGVVAAGDVANWPNPTFDGARMRIAHWDHAVEQGGAAARALLAGSQAAPYATVPWFWSDQYDRKIQLAGRIAADDEVTVVDGSLEDRRFVALFRRGDRLAGVVGMNRPGPVIGLRAGIAAGISFDQAMERFSPA